MSLPGSEAPFEPTAIQARALGHEIPLSCGMTDPCTGWGVHFRPPSLVATMTVAGDEADEFGPATPTAQQRSASAHDTAPSCPVPAGAGCPATSGVPRGSPRTGCAAVE